MKTAQWLTLSLVATLLTVTACSNTSTTGTSASQNKAKPAEENAQTPADQGSSRPVANVTITPGTDPMAMVFALRQPKEAAIGSEQIRVAYPSPDKAVVTVTRTGLQDDSVTALRTRYEFSSPDAAVEGAKQWSLTQVTEQNKCQRDRGPQDWSGDLCQ